MSFKAVLGEWPHQIFLGNAILFVVAMVGLWRLSENLASTASRRLVLILYALYPNFIYHCMFASKETLGAALLIWSMFLLFRPGEMSQRAWWGYLPAGLLIGYAALTQPALMLLPVVLLIYDGIVVRNRETIKRLLLVSLGFVVVLTPWSIRNYLVLDRGHSDQHRKRLQLSLREQSGIIWSESQYSAPGTPDTGAMARRAYPFG